MTKKIIYSFACLEDSWKLLFLITEYLFRWLRLHKWNIHFSVAFIRKFVTLNNDVRSNLRIDDVTIAKKNWWQSFLKSACSKQCVLAKKLKWSWNFHRSDIFNIRPQTSGYPAVTFNAPVNSLATHLEVNRC